MLLGDFCVLSGFNGKWRWFQDVFEALRTIWVRTKFLKIVWGRKQIASQSLAREGSQSNATKPSQRKTKFPPKKSEHQKKYSSSWLWLVRFLLQLLFLIFPSINEPYDHQSLSGKLVFLCESMRSTLSECFYFSSCEYIVRQKKRRRTKMKYFRDLLVIVKAFCGLPWYFVWFLVNESRIKHFLWKCFGWIGNVSSEEKFLSISVEIANWFQFDFLWFSYRNFFYLKSSE